MGQRSPDTAIAVAEKMALTTDRISVLRGRPPMRAGDREGLQDSPLLVCQITGVWLRVHTLSTLRPPFWNRLSDTKKITGHGAVFTLNERGICHGK